MQFNTHLPIYIQIADHIRDLILGGTWPDGERIPSVRDLAVELEVNPNTVIRTYSLLQEEGTLDNKRGIGYFTSPDARDLVLRQKRNRFIETELPQLFASMEKLGITFAELERYFETFQQEKRDHETEK